jgi:hypothetical protein
MPPFPRQKASKAVKASRAPAPEALDGGSPLPKLVSDPLPILLPFLQLQLW